MGIKTAQRGDVMGGYDLSAWPLFRSVIDDPQDGAAKPRTCLLISPADDPDPVVRKHAETVWKYIVRPALLDTDLSTRRFEMTETAGKIGQPMIDAVLDDDLIIAVLSHHNPNVYYSVALAQAAGRPLILMIEDGQSPAFETRDARVVTYSLDTDSMFSAVNVRRLQAAIVEMNDTLPAGQPFRRGASALNGGGTGGATAYESSRQFTYDRRLQMVRTAKTRVDMMGVANLAFAHHPDAIDVIRSKSGQGVEFRILQCSPANPGLASLIRQREPQKIHAIKDEIEAAAEAWKRICELPELEVSITLRRIQTSIPLASAMLTDQEVVATPYLSSRVTAESPTLHAHAGSAYHRVMQQEFDQVWGESVTLFRIEPRRGLRHPASANPPANTNIRFPNEPARAPALAPLLPPQAPPSVQGSGQISSQISGQISGQSFGQPSGGQTSGVQTSGVQTSSQAGAILASQPAVDATSPPVAPSGLLHGLASLRSRSHGN